MTLRTESGSSTSTELEWQFDALDLGAVERWIAAESRRPIAVVPGLEFRSAPSARRLVDTYYDTADWRIGRGGYTLRERRSGRSVEVTMKRLASAEEGFRSRLEVTESTTIDSLGEASRGPVAWRVRALAGDASLRAVIEVVTRRRPVELLIAGKTIAELVLDETSIGAPSGGRKLRLRRVEIEAESDSVEAARHVALALRAACALAPATLSKFEAGLLGTGLTIPGPPELGPTDIDASSTIGELALAALRRDARALLSYEPGTRLGEDIEELHQMRVATRRLRAALGLFSEVLPLRTASLRIEIGWLAGMLGKVRDLDVQLERTAEWIAESTEAEQSSLDELRTRLEEARQSAQSELLDVLNSRRYERLVSSLNSTLSTSTGRRSVLARTPAVIAMPNLLEAHQKSARRSARRARRSGVAEDFHRLRIKAKRLRYALEFTSDLYGPASRRYVKLLSRLQSRLGAMQDAEVAAERLRSLALELPEGAPPLSVATIFTVGGLAARYRDESSRLLAQLADEVDGLTGGSWQRLEELMRSERSAALAAIEARRPRMLPVSVLPQRGAQILPGTSQPHVETPAPPIASLGLIGRTHGALDTALEEGPGSE